MENAFLPKPNGKRLRAEAEKTHSMHGAMNYSLKVSTPATFGKEIFQFLILLKMDFWALPLSTHSNQMGLVYTTFAEMFGNGAKIPGAIRL